MAWVIAIQSLFSLVSMTAIQSLISLVLITAIQCLISLVLRVATDLYRQVYNIIYMQVQMRMMQVYDLSTKQEVQSV